MHSHSRGDKIISVSLIVLCQIAAMTLWFSATAAAANLLASEAITGQQAGLLTGAVQLGFVFGTLFSAWFGLADRLDPRRLFAATAAVGALANLALIVVGFDNSGTVILRFVTGAMLAGVYPVGMKMAVGWAGGAVGLMIGTLVGALTLGSALPHLFIAFGSFDWRSAIVISSACALFAALAIGFVGLGPGHATSQRFSPGHAFEEFTRRPVLLANLGYLGHMWELYAMWAWIGVFLGWGLALANGVPVAGQTVGLMTFAVVGVGALGCVGAGFLADRIGRTAVTIWAMIVSGSCAAMIGLLPAAGPFVLIAVALIWGVSIVADSAQFSASIAELAKPGLVGTMLTIQTCLGFLLTFVAIQAMPVLIDALSWRYAFVVLSIGPVIGVLAMWRLRREPEAVKLAGGRR